MKFVVLSLALASAIIFAADNAAVAPQTAAIPQSAIHNRQSTTIGGVDAISIPNVLSYQGRLTDTLGVPVADTTYSVTFRLYTVPSGGTPFWIETQGVTVKDGLFSVLLGSVTPVESLPSAGTAYLATTVSGGPELSPRIRIGSSAYAYLSGRAASADLLEGKDTTGFVRTAQPNAVTSSMVLDHTIAAVDFSSMGASAGQVLKFNGTEWAPGNDSVGQSGGGGTVRKVFQATGVVCSPNPITDSGTVRVDTAWGDARFVNEGQTSAITSAMIRDTTVNTADLKDAAVSMAKINQAGATSGQAIAWNGSAWIPATVTAGNSDMVDGYHAGNSSGQVPISNGTTNTNLNADLLDGSHGTAFAPASGSANYIQNQSASYQAANWKIVGQGQDSSSTGTALRAVSTTTSGIGIHGRSISGVGVVGVCSSATYSAVEGNNVATSGTGVGVGGFGDAAVGVYGYSSHSFGVYGHGLDTCGVYGYSSNSYGVQGTSSDNPGVHGSSTNSTGVSGLSAHLYGVHGKSNGSSGGLFESDSFYGVYGVTYLGGTGQGVGVYGGTPTYWGVEGFRASTQKGSGYSESGTRGGLWGYTYWGDTFAFGAAGYTYGDYTRTGGVIGGSADAATWGSLGYKNSSGNWYGGYGTSGWTSGSGLGNQAATGIGCGYGGGLMGGWLKGKYYGGTMSGDRYALYTKGNNYTTGYSAVMQNAGDKRVASYVPTSATVDVYASGVSEMKGGTASVTFPASFASIVSKDVPVVVTATPMGPAPIYLSSSDSKGFAVSAVDSKTTGSVKFSWIAVGRRAGYEKDPEVPAELCRTDFDSKMDGVMFNENDLKHSAQPVWFDGTQLRFDNPPAEARPPKPAQPVNVGLQAPPQAPTPDVPINDLMPSRATAAPAVQPNSIQSATTAPVPMPRSTQAVGDGK